MDTDALEPPSLAGLPPLVLEAISTRLYPDERSAVRFAATCRAAASVDTAALWEAWLLRRFGRESLPAVPLAGAWWGGRAGGRASQRQLLLHRWRARSAPVGALLTQSLAGPSPGPVKAAEVEGFVFVQGMTPAGEPQSLPRGTPLDAVADAARTAGAHSCPYTAHRLHGRCLGLRPLN